jgi:hypothetical protein
VAAVFVLKDGKVYIRLLAVHQSDNENNLIQGNREFKNTNAEKQFVTFSVNFNRTI